MEYIKFKDEIEFEERYKKSLFEKLERIESEMIQYRKEKRESQKWLLPYLMEIGQENIKKVTVKNKKGDKLWDFSRV